MEEWVGGREGRSRLEVPVTIEEAMKRWKGGEGGSGSEDLRVLIKVSYPFSFETHHEACLCARSR